MNIYMLQRNENKTIRSQETGIFHVVSNNLRDDYIDDKAYIPCICCRGEVRIYYSISLQYSCSKFTFYKFLCLFDIVVSTCNRNDLSFSRYSQLAMVSTWVSMYS